MPKGFKDLKGVVKRHPDGFGFFISDDPEQPDVYIPRKSMDGVMSNDRILVRVTREPGGDRFRGEVLEVLARGTARAMGAYHQTAPGIGILYDKSFAWGEDLHVTCSVDMLAKDGDLVTVQIEEYPGSQKGFQGKIISVIGDAADPQNDSIRMLNAHSIPYEFSKATLREAQAIPAEVATADMVGRHDIQKIPIITIDGKTAKDFDDAVFTEKTSSGFHLIVAIADVSHYVKIGSAIDDDAYLRGTSTYFPNFVAPMLPEKLSNELCSLKPNVPRLALVADMQLSFTGDLVKSEFYEGVIKSHARVTYGEAQEVVEGRTPEQFKNVEQNILRCADLAKILMAKRFREGSLDLEIPETEIQIDETGQPVDIIQSERLFAHRLIEELMLTANVAVAKFFKEKNVDAIYRIHEPPLAEAMENFENFLKVFGFDRHLGGGHLQKKMTKALEHFKGHPKEHILHILALRSLSQAKYSPHNVGHFGLGFEDYTHFTSPIRRYPDLIVHRTLKAILYPKQGYQLMSEADLESAGMMLSATEQRSVKAERQIKSIKKARFMAQHLGEEFDGVINSVTRFGIFVLLRQFDVDGLVRLEELGDDYFEYDEEKLQLVGKRSGITFEIGEPIKVVVARTDIEQGQIDLVLADQVAVRKGASKPTMVGRVAKAKGPYGKEPGREGHHGHGKKQGSEKLRHGKPSAKNVDGKRDGERDKAQSKGRGRKRRGEASDKNKGKRRGRKGKVVGRDQDQDRQRNRDEKTDRKFTQNKATDAPRQREKERSSVGRKEQEERGKGREQSFDSERVSKPASARPALGPTKLKIEAPLRGLNRLKRFLKMDGASEKPVEKSEKRGTSEKDPSGLRSSRVSKRRRPR
jgi:ribonuclease R